MIVIGQRLAYRRAGPADQLHKAFWPETWHND